jgi:modification methylase
VVESLPLSVWPIAQQPSRIQRQGRYVPASMAHPGKMLPALARHAIEHYSTPGDVVLDPMCGIGTSLVEAVHLGRDALGVEYEPRWAALARANLGHATAHGATGVGQVFSGDARASACLLSPAVQARVALVLTSPPYGPSVHGDVNPRPGQGLGKRHDRYSTDRANLAHVPHQRLLEAFQGILAACMPFLRPGGILVITVRPWRRRGLLIDFPAAVADVAQRAGLVPFERNVALLAALRDDRLVPRYSFFQLDYVRKARHAGIPLQVIAHEDVLVFRNPASAATVSTSALQQPPGTLHASYPPAPVRQTIAPIRRAA